MAINPRGWPRCSPPPGAAGPTGDRRWRSSRTPYSASAPPSPTSPGCMWPSHRCVPHLALPSPHISTRDWSSDVCSSDLEKFQGIGRRFNLLAQLTTAQGATVQLVDDYGHHPKELAAVFAAARGGWPDRRLVVAFQPHRYSRTRDLFDDFAGVLSDVDALVLTEVYPAGEAPIAGAAARALARALRTRGDRKSTRLNSSH